MNRRDSLNRQAVDLVERPVDASTPSQITLFSVPKPFGGATDTIQRNAFASWKQLAPVVDVLLLGDELGIAETATETGVHHAAGLRANLHGTPLLSSAFQLAHEHSTSPLLIYCNSDVILEPSFTEAIRCVIESPLAEKFIAFGRRLDVPIEWEVQFDRKADIDRLKEEVRVSGRKAPVVCKEYFVFPRTLFTSIPDFAVGRGNWDNWMIHFSRQQNIPVVDLSDRVKVIHQTHDYAHQQGSRKKFYVSGPEAKNNQQLAGGRHIISGCSGTWRLTEKGLRKTSWPGLNSNFWCDLPRFLRLIWQLFVKRS